jgi:hypothetical protein
MGFARTADALGGSSSAWIGHVWLRHLNQSPHSIRHFRQCIGCPGRAPQDCGSGNEIRPWSPETFTSVNSAAVEVPSSSGKLCQAHRVPACSAPSSPIFPPRTAWLRPPVPEADFGVIPLPGHPSPEEQSERAVLTRVPLPARFKTFSDRDRADPMQALVVLAYLLRAGESGIGTLLHKHCLRKVKQFRHDAAPV